MNDEYQRTAFLQTHGLHSGPKVPVLELDHKGAVLGTMLVPLSELDSVVGELCDSWDFGLGQLDKRELGRISFSASIKAPKLTMPKLSLPKLQLPKISASVSAGKYKKLTPAAKPVKKAPVRAAVKAVTKTGQKPIVMARKKPEYANSQQPSLAAIYEQLKRQGKIIDLLATKRQVTSEHNAKMSQDEFRDSVTNYLKKIDKQCTGDSKANYFARWNALKKATGVAISQT